MTPAPVDVYRSMFENAIEGIFQTTPEGKYLLVNPALAKMYGYDSPQDLITTLTHIGDQLYVNPTRRKQFITIMEQDGLVREFESEIFRKDGSTIWITETGRAVRNQAGDIVYYEGMVEDITRRRQAMEKIAEQAAIIDIAPAAITISDLSSKLIFWNQGAEKTYGWTSEEALGRTIPDLLFPEEGTVKYNEILRHVLQQGVWEGEVHQVRKGGQPVILESRRILMLASDGAPKAVLSINTDITEKKRIEEQIRHKQRLESIGTLAGGIAHDLNNVLTPISMSIGLLRVTASEQARNTILDSLEASTTRGANIVRQVLSFARGVTRDKSEVHLKLLFSEIDQIINETFPKNIQFHISIPEYLWTVSADATQLHQVLLNLCLNSRDAMPDGGHLTITVENKHLDFEDVLQLPQARVGPYILLRVTDTGAGIPTEHLDKIFDPFFTTKDSGQGTGLGLSMTLGIVKSHGGFITVDTKPGSGTTFRIYLPALLSATPIPTTTPPRLTSRGNGETILIIDDESVILSVTSQALLAYGYKVRTASNGAEGVDIYSRVGKDIAAVITDLAMPVMDGLACIEQIKRLDPDAAVILMSGQIDDPTRAKAAALGCSDILLKPCSVDSLLNTVRKVLEHVTSA